MSTGRARLSGLGACELGDRGSCALLRDVDRLALRDTRTSSPGPGCLQPASDRRLYLYSAGCPCSRR